MQLVIIGFGYSSAAIATALQAEARSLVVTVRSEAKANALRQAGWSVTRFDGSTITPELASALRQASHLLVSAPPDEAGDPILRHHADALVSGNQRWIGYLSTTGV